MRDTHQKHRTQVSQPSIQANEDAPHHLTSSSQIFLSTRNFSLAAQNAESCSPSARLPTLPNTSLQLSNIPQRLTLGTPPPSFAAAAGPPPHLSSTLDRLLHHLNPPSCTTDNLHQASLRYSSSPTVAAALSHARLNSRCFLFDPGSS